MKIDLSKKPEGATHINPHSGLWIKCFGGNSGSYQFFKDGEWEMGFGCMSNSYLEIAQPEPWTGEGLPPVGTVCETNVDGTWEESTVLAHHREMAIVFRYSLEHEAHMYDPVGESQVRLIRTPEQIAAEEREKAVFEIAHILIDNRHDSAEYHQAGRIYDAGFRKQPSP